MDNFPPTVDLTNAFPGREYMSREWWPGMTIRDYVAVHTDVSSLPNFGSDEYMARYTGLPVPSRDGEDGLRNYVQWGMQCQAILRYQFADAMMAERNKTL